MYTRISFETKKDLNPMQQQALLRFRGTLIQNGYTDIIHLSDKEPDTHLHFFDLPKENAASVTTFIHAYLSEHHLDWCMFRDS